MNRAVMQVELGVGGAVDHHKTLGPEDELLMNDVGAATLLILPYLTLG